ncbi:tRNA uridine-5-carboxymethylaminomethyl(34) synthesis GTPase MnmE [Acidobacteriota bacterium]
MKEDTIIAISTPLGHGGLGVVRLSGKEALSIAQQIFRPKRKTQTFSPRRAVLGNIYDFNKNEIFEEAFLIFFPAPRTFTREDVIEISCHGSPVILEEVVRLGIRAGARHSEPGEFTLRAYLNGRIDILQAEAIHDIIHASSIKQAKISFKQLEGGLSKKLMSLRKQVVDMLSRIEASLEFPEESLKISPKSITKSLDKTIQAVRILVESYNLGKTLAEGLTVALAGRANVGKSTLFNNLLEKERSIVTPFPGTTRDYLQEKIQISDSVLTLTDLAGMDKTVQPVEQEGIKRGKRLALEADGILLLLDVSKMLSNQDILLIKEFEGKNTILLFNKSDLEIKMDVRHIKERFSKLVSLEISAKTGKNISRLKNLMKESFIPPQGKSEEIILHLRQKLLLENIHSALKQGRKLLMDGYSEELYVEEIRKTMPLFGELTGEIRNEEILKEIFKSFCVGK